MLEHSPNIPNLTDFPPDRETRRALTLMAKIMQCVANGITEYEPSDILYGLTAYIRTQIPKYAEFTTLLMVHRIYK